VATAIADTVTVSGGSANILISGSGGTEPYDGIGTVTRPVGLYVFNITDANNCPAAVSVQVVSNVVVTPTPKPGNRTKVRLKIIKQ
jgi:hypothetical protein